jgi:hypothetical protein
LYLVTGCDKASSWGVASFSGVSGDGEVSLQFKAAQVGAGGASYEWQWETQNSVAVRTGPKRVDRENDQPQSQCLFVRGFKVAVRENPLAVALRGSVNLSSVQDLKLGDIFPKGSSVPFEGGSRLSLFGNIGRGRPGVSQDSLDTEFQAEAFEGEVILGSVPERSEVCPSTTPKIHFLTGFCKPYHPSTIINKYLLESVCISQTSVCCILTFPLQVPEAVVAVTHDDDWCSITEEVRC